MAGIIGTDNQFGLDLNHGSAGLEGTILAVYDVRICSPRAPMDYQRL